MAKLNYTTQAGGDCRALARERLARLLRPTNA